MKPPTAEAPLTAVPAPGCRSDIDSPFGVEADVLPGGHLIARSYPRELADQLISYVERRPG